MLSNLPQVIRTGVVESSSRACPVNRGTKLLPKEDPSM